MHKIKANNEEGTLFSNSPIRLIVCHLILTTDFKKTSEEKAKKADPLENFSKMMAVR